MHSHNGLWPQWGSRLRWYRSTPKTDTSPFWCPQCPSCIIHVLTEISAGCVLAFPTNPTNIPILNPFKIQLFISASPSWFNSLLKRRTIDQKNVELLTAISSVVTAVICFLLIARFALISAPKSVVMGTFSMTVDCAPVGWRATDHHWHPRRCSPPILWGGGVSWVLDEGGTKEVRHLA